jgi:hypothetical protein
MEVPLLGLALGGDHPPIRPSLAGLSGFESGAIASIKFDWTLYVVFAPQLKPFSKYKDSLGSNRLIFVTLPC